MQAWEYTSVIVDPTKSWYDALKEMGLQGWEAFFIEIGWQGVREIYFKRKII